MKNGGQQASAAFPSGRGISFLSVFLLRCSFCFCRTLWRFLSMTSLHWTAERWTWTCCVKIMDNVLTWAGITFPIHSPSPSLSLCSFLRCQSRMPHQNHPRQDGGGVQTTSSGCYVQARVQGRRKPKVTTLGRWEDENRE